MSSHKIKKIISSIIKTTVSLHILVILLVITFILSWFISKNFQPKLIANINKIYKIGQVVTGDNYSFYIKEVRSDEKGAGPLVPKKGNKFIIPKIVLKNTSNESFEFIPFLFLYVKDSQGNVYASEAIVSEGNQSSGLLLGGDVLQEEVGFSVPKDAKGLTLFFENGTNKGNKVTAVSLGK